MKHLKELNESIKEKLVIVTGDDWQGIYIDGKLYNQGHSINYENVIENLGYTIRHIYIENDETWEKLDYNCPEELEKVEIILNSEKYNNL
jgi:hypothetical protein